MLPGAPVPRGAVSAYLALGDLDELAVSGRLPACLGCALCKRRLQKEVGGLLQDALTGPSIPLMRVYCLPGHQADGSAAVFQMWPFWVDS